MPASGEPNTDRLDDEVTCLQRVALLILDEVGYIRSTPQAANLMFILVSRRHESVAMIVTSRSRSPTGARSLVAAALMGQLVHHAELVALKGDSYRVRDRDPQRDD